MSTLKYECNRRRVFVAGDYPTVDEISDLVERRLAAHLENRPDVSEASADYAEWNSVRHDLQDFMKQLQTEPKSHWEAGISRKQSPSPALSFATPAKTAQPTPHADVVIDSQSLPPKSSVQNPVQPDIQAVPSGTDPVQSGTDAVQTGAEPLPSARTRLPASPLLDDTDITFEFRAHFDKRSPLDHLSLEQQHAVAELMQDHTLADVGKLLAGPPFNIRTTPNSLRRFRDRHQKRAQAAARHENRHLARAFLRQSKDRADSHLHAAERLLQNRLLKCVIESGPNSSLNSLIEMITIIRKQTLAERKQTHEERS